MWMLPLYLHVNQKYDDDDDDEQELFPDRTRVKSQWHVNE